jgi:hypothetical protein
MGCSCRTFHEERAIAQSENLASVYESPGDLIRLALGFAVCLWIVSHLFMLPRTTEGYGTGSTSALWSRRLHGWSR